MASTTGEHTHKSLEPPSKYVVRVLVNRQQIQLKSSTSPDTDQTMPPALIVRGVPYPHAHAFQSFKVALPLICCIMSIQPSSVLLRHPGAPHEAGRAVSRPHVKHSPLMMPALALQQPQLGLVLHGRFQ